MILKVLMLQKYYTGRSSMQLIQLFVVCVNFRFLLIIIHIHTSVYISCCCCFLKLIMTKIKNSNCFEDSRHLGCLQPEIRFCWIEQKDGADTRKGTSHFILHFYLINNGSFPVDIIVVLKTNNKHWGCNSIS